MACCIVLGMIMANIVGIFGWVRSRARGAAIAAVTVASVTAIGAILYAGHLSPAHLVAEIGLGPPAASPQHLEANGTMHHEG